MRTSIFSHSWFGLATGALISVWAVPALADDCAEDSDCPKGFTCEVSEVTACADLPTCPEGENCEMTPPDCTTEEYRSCQSIDCSADSDCADGMACETVQHETCSYPTDPAPEPGMDPGSEEPLPADAAPPEGSCEVEERNYCVPRYLLTCETASDCGAGFTCETERCSCSSSGSAGSDSGAGGGSAGMPAPDGDGSDSDSDAGDDADAAERPAEPPPDGGETPADGEDDGVDDESCVCESGPGYCQLVVTGCDASSDCGAGMTCEDNPQGVCTGGEGIEEECTADPEKICMPPYVDLIESGAVDDAVDMGLDPQPQPGSSGGGEEDPVSDPNEPPRGSSGEGEEDGDENAEADGSSEDSSSSGGGCSVGAAGAPAGSWAALGLMLGAAVLGRRRRS